MVTIYKDMVINMANLKSNALTDKAIQNLKKPTAKKWMRDGGGLALCLSPSASGPWRHWYYIYTSPETGKKIYKPLGSYPDVGLSAARSEAALLKASILNGVDPKAREQREAEERREADEKKKLAAELEAQELTVSGLFDDYIKLYAMKELKGWLKVKNTLTKEVVEVIGKLNTKAVVAADLAKITSRIMQRDALVQANRVHAYTVAMFSWGVDNHLIQNNPFKGMKKPFKGERDRQRERVLSETEIVIFWKALDRKDLQMTDGIKAALRLVLLTAQRPGEVIGMHASEIAGNWWTIPGTRTKNGKTHRVYLSKTALALLGTLEGKSYLFPSPVGKGEKHIAENALNFALRRNASIPVLDEKGTPVYLEDGTPATENRLGVDHFTPHDLRRTAATLLAKDKIPYEHRERVLNHTIDRLDAIYNQHDFDHEKQVAAETLERRIKKIISGTDGKVIPISSVKKAA